MRRFEHFLVTCVHLAGVLASVVSSSLAHGEGAVPPGGAALARARVAWEQSRFDKAAPLYAEAIHRGGLTRTDLLECYVALGAARAILGKKKAALLSFRQAAMIEKNFVLPPEAGKKTAQLANLARHESRSLGLSASVTHRVPSGNPFAVDVSLDPKGIASAPTIVVFARDPAGMDSYVDSHPSASTLRFQVPASLTVSGAHILVRIDAVDAHQNQLATLEERVDVESPAPIVAPSRKAPSVAIVRKPVSPAFSPKITAAASSQPVKDEASTKHGGFWHSAWPYVLGGAALAAGGALVYFETRPVDNVSIGAARVLQLK